MVLRTRVRGRVGHRRTPITKGGDRAPRGPSPPPLFFLSLLPFFFFLCLGGNPGFRPLTRLPRPSSYCAGWRILTIHPDAGCSHRRALRHAGRGRAMSAMAHTTASNTPASPRQHRVRSARVANALPRRVLPCITHRRPSWIRPATRASCAGSNREK